MSAELAIYPWPFVVAHVDRSNRQGSTSASRRVSRAADRVGRAGDSSRGPQAAVPREDAADAGWLPVSDNHRGGGGYYGVSSFDRVNHDRLMTRLTHVIADKRLRWIIRGFLRAGVMEGGVVTATTEGTPQGGPLSPLLANFVLDELDRDLEERGLRFVRYADDGNVYVGSKRAADRAFENLIEIIEGKLKLKINRAKSAVDRPGRRKLLGFSFSPGPESKRRIATKALEKLKGKVRKLTRNGRFSFEVILHDLKRALTGWRSYFRIDQTVTARRELDSWIRRRLRALIWRRWKTCARRRRGLLERNVSADLAGKLSGSSLGSWHVSLSPAMHYAFPDKCFDCHGLPRLLQPS